MQTQMPAEHCMAHPLPVVALARREFAPHARVLVLEHLGHVVAGPEAQLHRAFVQGKPAQMSSQISHVNAISIGLRASHLLQSRLQTHCTRSAESGPDHLQGRGFERDFRGSGKGILTLKVFLSSFAAAMLATTNSVLDTTRKRYRSCTLGPKLTSGCSVCFASTKGGADKDKRKTMQGNTGKSLSE